MFYEITVRKNGKYGFFIVEWDNQTDDLIEFLKSRNLEEDDFSIIEFPILKFSEFRREVDERFV